MLLIDPVTIIIIRIPILSSVAKPYVMLYYGHLSESRSVQGGHHIVDRAANLIVGNRCHSYYYSVIRLVLVLLTVTLRVVVCDNNNTKFI